MQQSHGLLAIAKLLVLYNCVGETVVSVYSGDFCPLFTCCLTGRRTNAYVQIERRPTVQSAGKQDN